jgi:hypothetical protein
VFIVISGFDCGRIKEKKISQAQVIKATTHGHVLLAGCKILPVNTTCGET